MSFSENLRNIRTERKLSQEQLAELMGVSRQAVSKWERGSGYPETEKVIQIAKTLDVSTDYLLLGEKSNSEERDDSDKKENITVSDMKITIQCPNGTISAFHKFRVEHYTLPRKNKAKCWILGVDSSGTLGENGEFIGEYTSPEDANKELSDIYEALQTGEPVYELKRNIKNTEVITETKSNVVFSGERKIVVQSYDGKTMAAFYKFTISPIAFSGKNEPACCLCGTDKSS